MMPFRLVLSFVLAGFLANLAFAEEGPQRHHALSLIGEPKYKADFKHFDYVNPDAPKGGPCQALGRRLLRQPQPDPLSR